MTLKLILRFHKPLIILPYHEEEMFQVLTHREHLKEMLLFCTSSRLL